MSEQGLIVRDRSTDAVSVRPSFFDQKELALSQAALIGAVSNAETQENAIVALRDIKALRRDLEKARTTVKQPVLDLARAIDKAAKDADKELSEEEIRIAQAIAEFQQAEIIKAREAERARQAELDRIENERREAEYQARKKAEDEEVKRLQAERAAREECERKEKEAAAARYLALEAKTAKAREAARKEAVLKQQQFEEADAKRIADERRMSEERAAAEAQRIANNEAIEQRAIQAQEAVGGPVTPIQAAGQKSKPEFDFEVFDVWALARLHPGLVKIEARRQETLDAINKHGVTKIAGVRIFEVVKTQVRMPRPIDV